MTQGGEMQTEIWIRYGKAISSSAPALSFALLFSTRIAFFFYQSTPKLDSGTVRRRISIIIQTEEQVPCHLDGLVAEAVWTCRWRCWKWASLTRAADPTSVLARNIEKIEDAVPDLANGESRSKESLISRIRSKLRVAGVTMGRF